MSLKQLIFKPRWQHKDALIRAAAVASEDDPQLLAALTSICLEDEELEVRCAAIRRINQLPVLVQAAAGAQQAKETTLLSDRIRHLAASKAEHRAPLAERLSVVADSQDRALLEAVASGAPEAELRELAVARIDRQGLLGDIAIRDTEARIRRQAAARVTQLSTLQRVMESVRKSDKSLHIELQERLHQERLAAGDPKAVSREALAICEALEQLALGGKADVDPTSLEKDWGGISDLVKPDLAERHAAVVERLRNPGPPPKAASPVTVEPVQSPAPRRQTAPATPVDPAPAPKAPAPPDSSSINFEALEEKVALLLKQVDDGELHNALLTRSEILDAGKDLGRNARWKHIQNQLGQVQGQLRELRDWQHWSNNKIRQRLIREMQAVPGSGLHPDAVLAKLKELQSNWKELEHSEQIPGERHFSAPPWMWRQFNAAGREAFELTKPFLDKRSEVQAGHLDEVKSLCAELAELARAESPDWLALRKSVSRAARQLRDMGQIPPAARKRMGGRLRKAMERANARLQEHFVELEKIKRKLVRAAAQLAHIEDRQEAMAQAKTLQSEWKAAGSLWRGLEQKLWQEFREPIDPLFAEAKAEQSAQREARKEEVEAQQALCTGLRELLQEDDDKLPALCGKLQGLKEAWKDVEHPVAGLRKQFQELATEFEQRLRRQARQAAEAARERWWDMADRLHRLESAKDAPDPNLLEEISTAWPQEGETGAEIDEIMRERHRRLLEGDSSEAGVTAKEATEQGRLLCIRLEFLAGLSSPKPDQDLRMSYQVDRLSASLAGDNERLPARQEALQAEREWFCMPFIPDPKYDRFRKRIRTALREINKE